MLGLSAAMQAAGDVTKISGPAKFHPAFVAVADIPGRPRVLVIGDSISMGYTLAVRSLLGDQVNLHRPPENCRSTRQTLARIEEYLGSGKWDVIHFNCGIHDLTFVGTNGKGLEEAEGGVLQVPPSEYRENHERLVARLKQTGAVLIWASTTPVDGVNRFRRLKHVIQYNAIAAQVMSRHGVVVDDLFTLATESLQSGRMSWKDGVHFTAASSLMLGGQVAKSIEAALADQSH